MEHWDEDRAASQSTEEEVQKQECDLIEVEKSLDESTKILFQDFSERRIGATMTTTGLQLVQDAREACARGDPEACKRLELIRRFLKEVHRKDSVN